MTRFLRTAILLIGSLLLLQRAHAQGNQSVVNGASTTAVSFGGSGCSYSWVNSNAAIGLPASGSGDIPSFTAVNTGSGPAIATVTATPVPSAFAYITNYGSNTVSVVSTALQAVVATVPVGSSPYGVSVNPDGSLVYITNKGDNTVSVINTVSNKVTATINVGNSPTGIAVSPDGKTVYVANYGDNSVSVIAASANTISSTIKVGRQPYGIAVSPAGNKVYVTNYGDHTVSLIDPLTSKVTTSFAVDGNPTGIAVSPDGGTVYVSNTSSRTVSVVNAATNAIVKSVQVIGPPVGIAVSPDGTAVYVATGGYLTLIMTAFNFEVEDWADGSGPGIAISPDGSLVYLVSGANNAVEYSLAKNVYSGGVVNVGQAPAAFGNFIGPAQNCQGGTLTFTITVSPPPAVTVSAASGTITACEGTASLSPLVQQFTVTASGLRAGITVTAPADFEVSLSSTAGYAAGLVIPQSGQAAAATLYVRSSSAAPAGAIGGNVSVSTPGATSATVAVNGTVNALPAAGTVPDQSVFNTKLTTAVNFTGNANGFTWVNDSPGIGLAASGTGNIPSFQAINTGSSPVTATITVTPASNAYAYIAASGSQSVSVINTTTRQNVANIQVRTEPSSVAVSPDGTRAYATGGAGSGEVISTSSNTVIATFATGLDPWGIAVNPNGKFFYVANQSDNTVSVINAQTYALVTTIPAGANPYAVAVSPDGNSLAVSDLGGGTVTIINAVTNKVVASPFSGSYPDGLVFSPDGSKLYVANILGGTVTVFNTNDYTVLATITAGSYPADVAVNPNGKTVYVTNSASNSLSFINTATNMITRSVAVGQSPEGLSVTPDGRYVYEANLQGGDVWVIDAVTGSVVKQLSAGLDPWAFGDFISSGTGCTGQPISFAITVNPAVPTIRATALSGEISACVGSPSAGPGIAQLSVSGDFLTSAITVKASPGFEISLNAAGAYSTSLNLVESAGSVGAKVIYVRSAANAPSGTVTGTLSLTAAGATEQDIPLSGMVNPLPVLNPVTPQTVMNGQLTTPVHFSGTAAVYDWSNDTPGIGLPAAGSGDIAAFTAVNTGNFPVKATITVTPKHPVLAYIANTVSNTVSIINADDNQVVATVPAGKSPYAVAVSPDGLRAYVTTFTDNSVSVVDAAAQKVIATIKVGQDPVGISISPDGSMVYVANAGSNTVSVISTLSNTVVRTLGTDNYPTHTLVSPDGKSLYVANQYFQTIWVFDTASGKVINKAAFTGFPVSQMVSSADGSVLYFATLDNAGSILKVDTKTFTVLASLSVGLHGDAIALSPDGNTIYVPRYESGALLVINTATFTLTRSITVGSTATGVSLTPEGDYAYVTTGDNTVAVINTATNSLIASVPVGQDPTAVGSFLSSGNACDGQAQTFTITVDPTPKPFIDAAALTGSITACEGTASVDPAIEQFTLTAGNLTGPVMVAAPPGFEVAAGPSGAYSAALTVPVTGGAFSGTIYVRSSAQAAPGVNTLGRLTLSAAGDTAVQETVSETITAAPTVNAIPDQADVNGIPSTPVVFTGNAAGFNWTNDDPAIGLSGSGAGTLPSFNPVNTTAKPITAHIGVTPFNSNGCTGTPVSFALTVYPTPTLIVSGGLTALHTVYGTPSAPESFTLSGAYLTSATLITPPAGFEVSADGSVFGNTAAVNSTGNNFSAAVYIRLAAAAPAGKYSGEIGLSNPNVAGVQLDMPLSEVSPAPLSVTADNQTRPFGAVNPALTVTYEGFVNGDTRAQLSAQPVLTTSAVQQSPVGEYPIAVSGAACPNYSFSYHDGTLTVTPTISQLNIPNTFTPNGDNLNDTWEIKALAYYPSVTVTIYTRYGQQIFYSLGYNTPWDGSYKGEPLPSGTYYYIIDPQKGQAVISGFVTILR